MTQRRVAAGRLRKTGGLDMRWMITMPDGDAVQRRSRPRMNWDDGNLSGKVVMDLEQEISLDQVLLMDAVGVTGSGDLGMLKTHIVMEGSAEHCMILDPGIAYPVASLRSNMVPRATLGLAGGLMLVAINVNLVRVLVDPRGPVAAGWVSGGEAAPPRHFDARLNGHSALRLEANELLTRTAVAMQYVDALLEAQFVLLVLSWKGEVVPQRNGGHGCVGRAGSICPTSTGRATEQWRKTRAQTGGSRSATARTSVVWVARIARRSIPRWTAQGARKLVGEDRRLGRTAPPREGRLPATAVEA